MQVSCPVCSPGGRVANMSVQICPQRECQLAPPMDFRAPQRPAQALWKWNEQSWALCLKYSPAIPKGVPCNPSFGVVHVDKVLITGSLCCSALCQVAASRILPSPLKRTIKEAWRDGRNNQKNPERQKERERKRLRERKVKEGAVSTVKGTGGVSSPSQNKELVWEEGYDR